MRIYAVILSLLAFSYLSALPEEPHIIVTGSATRSVVPDTVQWTIQTETKGKHLTEVAKAHKQLNQRVLAYLNSDEFAATNVATTNVSIGENTYWDDGERKQDGYVATSRIEASTLDIENIATTWTALTDIEGLSIENVGFRYEKHNQVEEELELEALKEARRRAAAQAQALDASIGRTLVISPFEIVSPYQASRISTNAGTRLSSESASPIAPGAIKITRTMHVAFALIANEE